MNQSKTKTSLAVLFAALLFQTFAVQNASAMTYVRPPIHCTFDTCSVDINADMTLSLACEGRAMYSGPYQINTDYRTIQIECPETSGLRITTQSLPLSTVPSKATLFLSNKQVDGACQAYTAPTS